MFSLPLELVEEPVDTQGSVTIKPQSVAYFVWVFVFALVSESLFIIRKKKLTYYQNQLHGTKISNY